MAEKFDGKSTGNYDEDVSKRFGFQSQMPSSNSSSNPNWSPLRGQSIQPPSAPPQRQSIQPSSAPPQGQSISSSPRPILNLQHTNQFPYRDKYVQCASCASCYVLFGVFFVIVGSVTWTIAPKFKVGPNFIGPRPKSALPIVGPILLSIGISLLALTCIVVATAKKRTAAYNQNTGYVVSNFGGPQPAISGRTDNGNNTATLIFSIECGDHLPHNPHHHIPNYGSSSHLNQDDGASTTYGTRHNENHGSSSHSNYHDTSPSHCHDHGASTSAFDPPPSYDTVAWLSDTRPSTTTSPTTD